MQALVIYGPPGCGKTTHQMKLITEFKEAGYGTDDIAFLSHTRAAASEALSRLNIARSDLVSTIHSQCYRLANIGSSQLVDNKRLMEFSELMGVPIKNGSVDSEEGIEVGDEYLGIINKARNRLASVMEEYEDSHRPGSLPQFEAFVQGYHDWKKANGYIDFTDMLERVVKMGDRIQFHAPVMLIDEAQDLSALQWAVVRILARESEHLCIAGDDDQTLYVWGGADPAGMTQFEEEYGAHRLVLSQSHRIPSSIHDVALSVIEPVINRVAKKYLPRAEVGSVNRYGYLHAVQVDHGEDTLILCRAGAQKKEVEKWMIEQKIPYLNEGGKPGLYQTKVARAIRAYRKLQDGGELSPQEFQLLSDQCQPNRREAIRNRELTEFLKVGHMRALAIPSWSYEFYRDCDVTVQPTIRISSIHASKGREADRVVLLTGLTQRIAEGIDKDPDAEARTFYVGVTRAKQRLDVVEGDNGYFIP